MYPSKILLFGEYTLLLKSDALAIPYSRFKGEWAHMGAEADKEHLEAIRSNKRLKKFLSYNKPPELSRKLTYSLDLKTFEKDLENGLYFKSDIPEESGLGSSGALVAAIFDKYANIRTTDRDILKIRNCLSVLESFYHGLSSGIDPLVSYLKAPVFIKNNEICGTFTVTLEESLRKSGMFLLYCRQNGKTGELVNYFNFKCKSDSEYLKKIHKQYIPANNKCSLYLTCHYDTKSFFSAIRIISFLQLEIFSEMIPGELIPLINDGLETDLFYLKLCGSGGGGYFLGFTENIVKTENYFKVKGYQILIY